MLSNNSNSFSLMVTNSSKNKKKKKKKLMHFHNFRCYENCNFSVIIATVAKREIYFIKNMNLIRYKPQFKKMSCWV